MKLNPTRRLMAVIAQSITPEQLKCLLCLSTLDDGVKGKATSPIKFLNILRQGCFTVTDFVKRLEEMLKTKDEFSDLYAAGRQLYNLCQDSDFHSRTIQFPNGTVYHKATSRQKKTFNQYLIKISDSISPGNLEIMVVVTPIPESKKEGIREGHSLFTEMKQCGCISENDVEFLEELFVVLKMAKAMELLAEYKKEYPPQSYSPIRTSYQQRLALPPSMQPSTSFTSTAPPSTPSTSSVPPPPIRPSTQSPLPPVVSPLPLSSIPHSTSQSPDQHSHSHSSSPASPSTLISHSRNPGFVPSSPVECQNVNGSTCPVMISPSMGGSRPLNLGRSVSLLSNGILGHRGVAATSVTSRGCADDGDEDPPPSAPPPHITMQQEQRPPAMAATPYFATPTIRSLSSPTPSSEVLGSYVSPNMNSPHFAPIPQHTSNGHLTAMAPQPPGHAQVFASPPLAPHHGTSNPVLLKKQALKAAMKESTPEETFYSINHPAVTASTNLPDPRREWEGRSSGDVSLASTLPSFSLGQSGGGGRNSLYPDLYSNYDDESLESRFGEEQQRSMKRQSSEAVPSSRKRLNPAVVANRRKSDPVTAGRSSEVILTGRSLETSRKRPNPEAVPSGSLREEAERSKKRRKTTPDIKPEIKKEKKGSVMGSVANFFGFGSLFGVKSEETNTADTCDNTETDESDEYESCNEEQSS